MNNLFVTGIGTGVGKTIVSSILVESWGADYWKPIQSGDLHHTDTQKVRELVSNSVSKFHPERFRFREPVSPHRAAELDGEQIALDDFQLPITSNRIIIEGAGGVLVPLNEKHLMIDLISKLSAEVILVSSNYLGSINHTLLSAEVLRSKNIPVKALVFCGEMNEVSENYITNYLNIRTMRVPSFRNLNSLSILEFSRKNEISF